ncbi:hypothetical protein QP150_13205 [Sphingomonas sp. 22L2VL55-3]
MRTAIAVALLAAPLLVGGCGRNDDPTKTAAPSGFTPPETRAPAPIAGQAQTTPITAYVGKYPHDAVDGVDFFDRTDVATGLVNAVGDAKLREMIRGRSGPATPFSGWATAWRPGAAKSIIAATTTGRSSSTRSAAKPRSVTMTQPRWARRATGMTVRPPPAAPKPALPKDKPCSNTSPPGLATQ